MKESELKQRVADLIGVSSSAKELAFEIFIKNLIDSVDYDQAVKIPALGTFQFRKNEDPEQKDFFLFLPEGDESTDTESFYLKIDVEHGKREEIDFDDSVFSPSIGKNIFTLTRDEENDSHKDLVLQNSIDDRTREIILGSELVDSFNIWDTEKIDEGNAGITGEIDKHTDLENLDELDQDSINFETEETVTEDDFVSTFSADEEDLTFEEKSDTDEKTGKEELTEEEFSAFKELQMDDSELEENRTGDEDLGEAVQDEFEKSEVEETYDSIPDFSELDEFKDDAEIEPEFSESKPDENNELQEYESQNVLEDTEKEENLTDEELELTNDEFFSILESESKLMEEEEPESPENIQTENEPEFEEESSSELSNEINQLEETGEFKKTVGSENSSVTEDSETSDESGLDLGVKDDEEFRESGTDSSETEELIEGENSKEETDTDQEDISDKTDQNLTEKDSFDKVRLQGTRSENEDNFLSTMDEFFDELKEDYFSITKTEFKEDENDLGEFSKGQDDSKAGEEELDDSDFSALDDINKLDAQSEDETDEEKIEKDADDLLTENDDKNLETTEKDLFKEYEKNFETKDLSLTWEATSGETEEQKVEDQTEEKAVEDSSENEVQTSKSPEKESVSKSATSYQNFQSFKSSGRKRSSDGKGWVLYLAVALIIIITIAIVYFFVFSSDTKNTSSVSPEVQQTAQIGNTSTDSPTKSEEENGVEENPVVTPQQQELENKASIENQTETQPPPPPVEKEETTEVDQEPQVRIVTDRDSQVDNLIFFDGKNYNVQVSSWMNEEKAIEEAKRLKQMGHNSIVKKAFIESKGGTWYRVRIGNFKTIDDAKQFLNSRKY